MAGALQAELLAVPGIAGAEVEDDGGVAGVRVQLAEGADADAVGAAVRRILIAHGMRPAAAAAEESEGYGPPPPPGAPGSVVSFPLVGEHARAEAATQPAVSPALELESVAVEETPSGVSVLVRSTGGARATRSLGPTGSGMDEAVADSVAELVGQSGTSFLGAAESEIGGYQIITVLLGKGDERLSGSAVQRGGRAYATARAVWAALDRS